MIGTPLAAQFCNARCSVTPNDGGRKCCGNQKGPNPSVVLQILRKLACCKRASVSRIEERRHTGVCGLSRLRPRQCVKPCLARESQANGSKSSCILQRLSTVMIRYPPLRRTRAISRTGLSNERSQGKTPRATTRWNVLSGKGRGQTSPVLDRTFSTTRECLA